VPAPAPVADALGHTDKPFSGSFVPASVARVAPTASITHQEITTTVNAITSTDTIKYLPSIDLRLRYEGEQNPMIGWRTVSQDTPAQSLVYVDGILVSNLLGNYYCTPFTPKSENYSD